VKIGLVSESEVARRDPPGRRNRACCKSATGPPARRCIGRRAGMRMVRKPPPRLPILVRAAIAPLGYAVVNPLRNHEAHVYPIDQLSELKKLYPDVSVASDGGVVYLLIPAMPMPSQCNPDRADVLLCPSPRDGYSSRLFFSAIVACASRPNWNRQNERILERNWVAYSFKVPSGLRLAQLIAAHLRGLQ
jgi:hypothetical protein